MNNSKVVEYSKGFLGITVNPLSNDWTLKFWPLNLYFNPKARDMAPNEKSAANFVIKVNILTPAVFYSKKIDKKVKNDKLIAKIVNFW